MRALVTGLVVVIAVPFLVIGAETPSQATYTIGAEPPAGAPVKEVAMTAKKYEFAPAAIEYGAGTVLLLSLRALDKTHGFRIEGFDRCVEYDPKHGPVTIRFYTDKPGDYPFSCCHFCGFGHGHMKGIIKVKASNPH